MLDADICHAACDAKDRRFDGRFYIGVTSTGIYCRCICPARLVKRGNRTFWPSAAAAEGAGFRPCLICRPERAPGLAPIDAPARLAAAAYARIEAGALEERGLEALARDLGVTSRHLRRVMNAEFGASPIQIAQTGRLLSARRLLGETALSVTEIAFASGFRSLRRFNATMKDRYGAPPTKMRGRKAIERGESFTVSLSPRGDYALAPMLDFLRMRALPGVETCDRKSYARTLKLGDAAGWLAIGMGEKGLKQRTLNSPHFDGERVANLKSKVALETFESKASLDLKCDNEPDPSRASHLRSDALALTLSENLAPHLRPLVANVRGAFDLDADMIAVDAHLARDGELKKDVKREPGVRVPGMLDGFECAVRAVLGQQVTVAGGRTLTERLVAKFGAALPLPLRGGGRGWDETPKSDASPRPPTPSPQGEGEMLYLFPDAAALANAGAAAIATIGLPRKRAETLHALAVAAADGKLPLARGAINAGRAALALIPGVGPWTIEYVAMRALGDPDAYPSTDIALINALGRKGETLEHLKPWRAYAAIRLWRRAAAKGARK